MPQIDRKKFFVRVVTKKKFYKGIIKMNEKQEKWERIYERINLPWLENPIPGAILEKFANHFNKGDKILDYGGGNGVLSKILIDNGLDVTCSDISEKALILAKKEIPTLKIIQASNPSLFYEKRYAFDGVLVWGVMHHINKKEWGNYLNSFYSILKSGGILLIGGHSTKDIDFEKGYRISPTTGDISHAVNEIRNIAEENNFRIDESDFYEFKEGFSGKKRIFNYFFLIRG